MAEHRESQMTAAGDSSCFCLVTGFHLQVGVRVTSNCWSSGLHLPGAGITAGPSITVFCGLGMSIPMYNFYHVSETHA